MTNEGAEVHTSPIRTNEMRNIGLGWVPWSEYREVEYGMVNNMNLGDLVMSRITLSDHGRERSMS